MTIEALPPESSDPEAHADGWAYRVATQLTQVSGRDELRRALVELERVHSGSTNAYERGIARCLAITLRVRLESEGTATLRARLDSEEADGRRAALRHLVINGRSRPSEIRTEVGVSTEHLSRVLRTLLNQSLVTKHSAGGTDRRAVLYEITELGRIELERANQASPRPRPTAEKMRSLQRAAARALLDKHIRDRHLGETGGTTVSEPERVRTAALRVGDSELYWDATAEVVTTHRHAGDERSARQALVSFRSPAPESDNRQAWLAYQTAKLDPGSPSNELTLLERAWQTGRDRHPSQLGLWSAHSLAVAHYRQGKLRPALFFATDAHGQSTRLGDSFATVTTGVRLALITRVIGRPRTSLRLLDQLDQMATQFEDPQLRGECLLQRGEALRYLEQLPDAAKSLAQARKLLGNEPNLARERAFTLSAIGAAQFDRGDFAGARRALTESLRLAESPESIDIRALSLRRSACIHLERHAFAKAQDAAQQSLSLYTNLSDIGTIEALACLAQAVEHPQATLEQLEDRLRLVAQQSANGDGLLGTAIGEIPTTNLDGHSWRTLDRWVLLAVKQEAERRDLKHLAGNIERDWRRLEQQGIAAPQQVRIGTSVMGKEPALSLVA